MSDEIEAAPDIDREALLGAAIAGGDLTSSAKLVLLVLGRLTRRSQGFVTPHDVAAATGISGSSTAAHLRKMSKDHPDLVERKAWLDDDERKVVRYRALF